MEKEGKMETKANPKILFMLALTQKRRFEFEGSQIRQRQGQGSEVS